jgi:pyruvate/2-oxoglutarate dehydrogenase complex dihydrolipoamide acyltransferase (E2) component
VRALALTARQVPEINRCYFPTVFGDKVIEFDHVSVNLPVMLREGGREHLMAATVRDADEKTVDEIHREIQAAQRRTLDDTRLTKHVARRPNTLAWRSLLRAVHFASYELAAVDRMGGGGLSVSSIITHREEPARVRSVSMGPTAVTLALTGVRRDGERTWLEMGMGIDHAAISGMAARRATDALCDLLSSRSAAALEQLA